MKTPLSIAFVALALVACGSPQPYTQHQLKRIAPGLPTAELVELLGEPTAQQTDDMGNQVWIFDNLDTVDAAGEPMPPQRMRVTVVDGRVVAREMAAQPAGS